jgi:hypothetical protein
VDADFLLTCLRELGFHLVLHGHKHFPLVHADNAALFTGSTQPTAPLPPQIVIVSGGSASSSELPREPHILNTYNWITIKWVPAALQARVRVETAGLVTLNDRGARLLPTHWHWDPLGEVDAILDHGRVIPDASALAGTRKFDESADEAREAARLEAYGAGRYNFPVVAFVPSLDPDQVWEARVWVVHHPPPRGATDSPDSHPTVVRWSAGPKFGIQEIHRDSDPLFCTTFEFYGPMLVQAEMEFPNGEVARSHVYVRMLADHRRS